MTQMIAALPLRLKILALASVLLVAFAITTAVSAYRIRGVMEEIATVVEYYMTLANLMAEVDVISFEYELIARRLITSYDEEERTRELLTRKAAISERLPKVFAEAKATLARAVDDPRNDAHERVQLARLDGVMKLLSRNTEPFLAAGVAVQRALEAGRAEEAVRLVRTFRAYEAAFGPDLADVRRTIEQLTRHATEQTQQHERNALRLNVILFLIASIVGLGFVAVLAHKLTQAFRRLLEGTRSVEDGQLPNELPVTTRDEVGQLTVAFNRMIGELRAKERIKETFGQFLDPRLITRVLGEHAGNGAAAAERRVVTVFFSDIKAFSSLSEQLTADVIVRLLNGYFSEVTKIIRDKNGIVDKFIGDAVMAFWTPPFSAGDQHATDACLAALAQQAALDAFRQEISNLTGLRRNVPDFRVRMGISTGEVVVGTLGSETTKSYTVIGDTVNVASRLESANKAYGTSIIITEDTLRLAQEAVEVRELDLLVVAGKTEPLRVYELLAAAGQLRPELVELRGAFEEGLTAYRAGKWEVADRKFRECLRIAPDDAPSKTFLERVAVLQAHQPSHEWNGVWTMENK